MSEKKPNKEKKSGPKRCSVCRHPSLDMTPDLKESKANWKCNACDNRWTEPLRN